MRREDEAHKKRIEDFQKEENERLEKEEYYGLNNITTISAQEKRKWYFESAWINPKTNKINTISTKYNKPNDSVLTYLNDTFILDHKTNSGSKKTIEILHLITLKDLKNEITNGKYELF